jgi:hypothetical protein
LRDRHCERSNPEQQRKKLDCFVASLLAMTDEDARAFSWRDAPKLSSEKRSKRDSPIRLRTKTPPYRVGVFVHGLVGKVDENWNSDEQQQDHDQARTAHKRLGALVLRAVAVRLVFHHCRRYALELNPIDRIAEQ